MQSWPERHPGRLDYELACFAELGLDFELDAELRQRTGKIRLCGAISHNGKQIALEVAYPDLFPYLRPEVYAKELQLDRHQNPYEGNLCLLDRSSRAWKPSYTAAWLVAEKVPYLLDLLDVGGKEMALAESPQGEPFSTYFPGVPGTVVFIPEEMVGLGSESQAGSGRIGVASIEGPRLALRGAIVELVEKRRGGRKTRHLAKAEQRILERFNGTQLPFRWVRLPQLPTENTAAALLEAIAREQPGFATPRWEQVADGEIAIVGAVFAEEVRQGQFEDGWLFAIRARTPAGVSEPYLVRGDRLSRADLEARLPETIRLAEDTVALAGLGALGGAMAIELAKGGLGTLRGLDFDVVEAGTTTRWVAGITTAGRLKAGYLNERITVDYPYTRFEPVLMQIGGSCRGDTESELEVLDAFLGGAALLIDATAEIGIQQALAAAAEEYEIPALFVSATEGARGGIVARVHPPQGGCWLCLQMALESGAIPLPPHSAESLNVQPRGCSDLTYIGAGFDLLPIAAQGTRLAAATLAPGAETGSVVFVCSLPGDPLLPPDWSRHTLDRNPECPLCGDRWS
jgi:ThiF family